MTTPALPTSGSTSWYSWAAAVDNSALRGGGAAAGKPAVSDRVIYVSKSSAANDANDGLAWGSPKATIAGALTALAGGVGTGILRLGYGTWTENGLTPPSNCNIEGLGPELTIVQLDTDGGTLITAPASRFNIRNLSLVFTTNVNNGTLLDMSNVFDHHALGVRFRGQYNYTASSSQYIGQVGIHLRNNAGDNFFTDCSFSRCGVAIQSDSWMNYLIGCRFSGNGHGIQGGDPTGTASPFPGGVSAVNCTFTAGVSAGIGGAVTFVNITGSSRTWVFSGCWFDGQANDAIIVGKAGTAFGPYQFTMHGCPNVAGGIRGLTINAAGNVDLDGLCFINAANYAPTYHLSIDATNAPSGIASGITAPTIAGAANPNPTIATSVFPSTWTLPDRRAYLTMASRGETPEAFGTVGAGDDTAAIMAAHAACVTSGGGDVILQAGRTYVASALKLKSHCGLAGGKGTTLSHKAGATDHLVSLFDNTQVDVWVRDLTLDGNKANQTNAVDVINLDYTGNNIVADDRLLNLIVQNAKNNGLSLGVFSRVNADQIRVYNCDNYGVYLLGGDSKLSHVDVGQSGKDGWYIAGRGYQIDNCKSWFSGRLDGVGRGFVIADSRNTLIDPWSQDNMGFGFDINNGGTAVVGTMLIGAWSENDNANAGSNGGFNLVASTNGIITGIVRTYSGGRHGTPLNGLVIDGACLANDITLNVTNTSGDPVTGAGLGLSTVRLSGREGRIIPSTPGSTYNPAVFLGSTFQLTLGHAVTIANPAAKPAGFKIRFILIQDATGGRAVTFDTDFLVNWTPNRGPGDINVIDFESDGTHWIQTSAATAAPGPSSSVAVQAVVTS